MADIFISYASVDRDLALALSRTLEAEAYTVWWDSSLIPGDDFRDVITAELNKARAVIVIWTGTSVQSDWVRSESGRALADRKLIPVKKAALTYKDLPPPFDVLHTENIFETAKIIAAVKGQLAKPAVAPDAMWLAWRKVRRELLSWFAICGGAISLATNIQGLLNLTRWTRWLFANWINLAFICWQKVLFFFPRLGLSDSVFLTFACFSLAVLISATKQVKETHCWTDNAMIGMFSLVTVVLFALPLGIRGMEGGGYMYEWLSLSPFTQGVELTFYGGFLGNIPGLILLWWFLWYVLLFAAPFIVALLVYVTCTSRLGLHVDRHALASRLARVLVGVVLIALIALMGQVLGHAGH